MASADKRCKEAKKRAHELSVLIEKYWLSFFPKSSKSRKMQGMIKAYKLMRDATFQPHTGHWDPKGTSGLNCYECNRADKLRSEADRLFEESKR